MKIVFMGTPEFAVPSFRSLLDKYGVTTVFCQPDKPNKRGNKIVFGAVKQAALENDIPVEQPLSLKCDDVMRKITVLTPDLIVVAAYGKILPPWLLEVPRYGCINVHASLLPKYRGAAPIQWALINGESETGVTIMQMNEGLDTGDILKRSAIPIEASDTYGTLSEKLSILGAEALIETLTDIPNIKSIPQDDHEATFAPLIDKSMERLNWADSGKKIVGLIRGLNPSPGVCSELSQKKLKLWCAEIYGPADTSLEKGEVIEVVPKKGIVVNATNESVILTELQLSGKNKMSAVEFIRGNKVERGMMFE